MHVFVKLLSILEFCQVYVLFVFMGASRVNSRLDTWEIECISCEALSLFILELINDFGLLGWFSRMSWLFGSLHVRCYPFLSLHLPPDAWVRINKCCLCTDNHSRHLRMPPDAWVRTNKCCLCTDNHSRYLRLPPDPWVKINRCCVVRTITWVCPPATWPVGQD